MIGKTVSHYRILEQIGAGGMGVVYKAEDTRLSRIVALKFLPRELISDERFKRRFIREARAAASLDQHPNICHIHEVDETPDGRLFISMAYYDGTSLQKRLERGPLSVREAFGVVLDVADGLSLAHSKGIIHRDLKPSNVMITSDGYVKIVDFGLAKIVGASKLTRSGTIPGTIAYMAPEQVKSGEVDAQTDIWSLGVLAYETLTGKLPFRGKIDEAMVYSILSEDPPPIGALRTEVPEQFVAIVNKCLAKDPEARYKSATEVVEDLTRMAEELAWISTPGGYKRSTRINVWLRPKRRRNVLLGVCAGVVLAVTAVVAFWPKGDTTELRVAAFPFRNLAKVEFDDALVAGLFEKSVGALELISNDHPSMWVVPFDRIVYAGVPTLVDVKDAFGVNRVITGAVQRFGDGYRLSIELLDAETVRRLAEFPVDFDTDGFASLPGRVGETLAEMMGVELSDRVTLSIRRDSAAENEVYRDYLEGLGYLQMRDRPGMLDQAVSSLSTASAFPPAVAALAQAYSYEYDRSGDLAVYQAAMAACSTALAADTVSVAVNLAAGRIFEWASETADAKRAYQRIIEVDPKNTNARVRTASVLLQEDRPGEAEALYNAVIELKPDYYRGYALLADLFRAQERSEDAIYYYKRALELAPNEIYTINRLAEYYYLQDRWREAREMYQRAFAIRAECGSCQGIGSLFYYEGRYSEAADYFQFALQYCDSTRANHYMRWQDLGAALWLDGRKDEARAKFTRAVELGEMQRAAHPTDGKLLAYLGGCYALLGERDKALDALTQAADHSGNEGFVFFLISYAYEQMGMRERALHYIGEAIRHHQSVDAVRAEPLMRELVEDIRFQQLVEATGEGPDPPSGVE